MINNNNNLGLSRRRDSSKPNILFETSLDSSIDNRYCVHCHARLVHNPRNVKTDKYIYTCPVCNCGPVNIHNTEPKEKIIVNFPTYNANTSSRSKSQQKIMQADRDGVGRSQYFIKKMMEKKKEIEGIEQDPHLAIMMRNNKITITNVDYNNSFDDDDDDDSDDE